MLEYRDEKHSGEQKFYDPDGKLLLHNKFDSDPDGLFTKLRLIDDSGKQRRSEEIRGNVAWKVIYDEAETGPSAGVGSHLPREVPSASRGWYGRL